MEQSILMWNRLESSVHNENQLENALCFEIRDALWMLTRQWQFGEFEAEDAGSAAFVNISAEQSPITGIGAQNGPVQKFDINNAPFETIIEHEIFVPEIAERIEMGKHWERILTKRLPAANAKAVIAQFKKNVRFHFNTGIPKEPVRDDLFLNAQKYSDDSWLLLVESISNGRAIDGFAFLQELRSGKQASIFLTAPDDSVNKAGKEFMEWFDRVYGQSAVANTWHPQHLEYQPQLAFTGSTGQSRVLRKEEYYGDGIEWHGMAPKTLWNDQTQPPVVTDLRKKITDTVIPSSVRFRGMPSARLWEMEDAQVDFGSIRASSTDLSKMLFAEFGLVYGNDWLVAPLKFSCGNMCRITGMIVTDTFGNETIVQEIPPDNKWSFFQTITSETGKRWLFLANSSELIQESNPVEKVSFLRDEMANLVWGVEEIIADPYGGGRDAEILAKKSAELVQSLTANDKVTNEGKLSSDGWIYKTGTLMAENRIPFIPMVTTSAQQPALGKRTVVLQRAAMPRVLDGTNPVRIRPRTRLLGFAGGSESERPDPLFVFEEEIPKTGIKLNQVWKRTRWFNGQTHTWLARQKTVGVGEVDANFRFDVLKKINK